jgi:hypothetical protein
VATDAFVVDVPPRPLTEWEQNVVSLLVPVHDLGALKVHSHCPCGCASISFVRKLRDHTLLAEAEGEDTDGMTIWFLLFGSDDRSELDELEIQRADGAALRSFPDPETLRLVAR